MRSNVNRKFVRYLSYTNSLANIKRFRKIITIFILTAIILSCQNNSDKNNLYGSYSSCGEDGVYGELKITDKYTLKLTSKSDEIAFFRSKVVDSHLIISLFEQIQHNDTLTIIEQSKDKIVLKSANNWEEYEFRKVGFKIDEIDSTNLESWKKKTLSDFKKRAESKNCPDLRTDEEKVDSVLRLDDTLDEELIIIRTDENNR